MTFLLLALLMMLVAGACVAVPLWHASGHVAKSFDGMESMQRDQLAELERDVISGVLSEADYRDAQRDLEAELAQPQAQRRPFMHSGHRRVAAAVAALLVVACASTLYWYFGNWRAAVQGIDTASAQSVRDMVAQLDRRLHSTDGNDLDGWSTLGHAYVVMGRYTDAVDAYSHARSLSQDHDAEVLAGYAESVTLANPRDFMDKALPAFEKALRLDPHNPLALWYGGLGALQRGEKPLAVRRWQALLALNPPDQYRQLIEKSIIAAGGVVAPPGAEIHLRVSLAPALQASASQDETLFVFARAAGDAGGPPLAVRRLKASVLPADITLSDRDAMVAGQSFTTYPSLIVTARLSRSGSPLSQSGDLTGQVQWNRAQNGVLNLSIDTVVK